MTEKTFIIDCPNCKAKVAAIQKGVAEQAGISHEEGEPYGERLHIGECPSCHTLVAGRSVQLEFGGIDAEDDRWSDVTRLYPDPPKVFSSRRIPKVLTQSLLEAHRAMQAGAYIAACAMFGRALEAMSRHILSPKEGEGKRRLMLGAGIRELRDRKIIDERLFNWSQDLHAFRNLAAHPEEEDDTSITPQDAEDLQVFVHAITEYVYDLTDRYEDFQSRKQKPHRRTSAR
ncbi:MAG: DUF4145 domain-containing protein [Xanthobacteraceae bacterium]